ncbi:ATP-dependent DNA helicase PIF1-like [Octopus vulgaris]|uniref:ATP-dependent DNA helicase n=1 Tax=Octopus vulgaris TaxID=6645 RepID=A0AA36B885_OCTVU|nr:ATP-dependent DNA helicase PIF1-like [Octopus vulgaris]
MWNNCNMCIDTWTGIASTLLSGGKTIRSLFKLPVPLTETSICNVPATSDHANHLQNLDLIILDEASVIPSFAVNAIDKALRDINGITAVFGGKSCSWGETLGKSFPYCQEELVRQLLKSVLNILLYG